MPSDQATMVTPVYRRTLRTEQHIVYLVVSCGRAMRQFSQVHGMQRSAAPYQLRLLALVEASTKLEWLIMVI
jgi:hypothetical protein